MTPKFKIVRVAQAGETTLSHLYINDIFACYLLEDAVRQKKVKSATAIPVGKYKLKLTTTGNMSNKYASRYGPVHKGMIEIAGIGNYSGVYIHIGNTFNDTAGCPLTGFYYHYDTDGNYCMVQSRHAYELVYNQLLKGAECGADITVQNLATIKNV